MNRVLFVSRDRLPLWRPDISVLFGRHLRRMGWNIRWGVVQEAGALTPEWIEPGSLAVIRSPKKLGSSIHWLVDRVRDMRACMDVLRGKTDCVIVRDDYVSLILIGLVAKGCAVPCVFWMSFLMEDGYVARGELRRGLMRWLRIAYGRAYGQLGYWGLRSLTTMVFSQSETMSALIRRRARYRADIVPVHMAVDIDCLPASSLMASSTTDELVVGYSGVISLRRGFDRLLSSVSLCRAQGVPMRLVIIGWFESALDEAAVQAQVEALGLESNVEFRGRMAWAEALAGISGCDAGVSPIPSDVLYGVASPTKFFEYLAIGVPVVATHHPVHDAVRSEVDYGVLVSDSAEGFADGFHEMWRRKQSGTLRVQRAVLMEYARSRHSYAARAHQVHDALEAHLRRYRQCAC